MLLVCGARHCAQCKQSGRELCTVHALIPAVQWNGQDELPLRGIVAAAIERIAAANTVRAAARAADRPILADGQNEILTATRIEAAHGRQDRTQADLIAAHPADEKCRH